MGNEIFVYFTTGNGKQYVSRIVATEEPKAGKGNGPHVQYGQGSFLRQGDRKGYLKLVGTSQFDKLMLEPVDNDFSA